MTSRTSTAATPASVTPVGAGRLALHYQEVLTAIARLRVDRQSVSDAAGFRSQMLALLRRADEESRAVGFEEGDVQLATFAVVALLDESVLNSTDQAWSDWSRRPLQDELFGGHMAGEWFFQHVDRLLARPDSPSLADLIELHTLCLLLGFRGRYGAADRGALHATTTQLTDRLKRIRGTPSEFVDGWRPPDDAIAPTDPWIRRLVVALAACVVLAGVLWGSASLSLRGAARDAAPVSSPAPAATS